MIKRAIKSNKLLLMFTLLPRWYRRRGYWVLFLTLIGAFLEMVGVGLLLPVIGLITNLDNVWLPSPAANLLNLESFSQNELVLLGFSAVAAAYLVRGMFLGFVAWIQFSFFYDLKAEFTQMLFVKHLSKNYVLHMKQNSSELVRNLTTEAHQLVGNALQPAILLVTEVAVILALTILLVWVEPRGALVLASGLFIAIFVFQRVTKYWMYSWGEKRQFQDGQRIKVAQEALGSIRDVILLRKESYIANLYGAHNFQAAKFEGRQMALAQAPRLWLETLGVFCLCSLTLLVFFQDEGGASALPIVAMFGAAALRMLPSGNRVLASIQGLRYAKSAIDLFYDELMQKHQEEITQEPQTDRQKRIGEKIVSIKISDVEYEYPESPDPVLRGVSLDITGGEKIAIIGESGSGKSTFVDLLIGFLKPTSGSIEVNGVDISGDITGWENKVGYVHQNYFLADDTLQSNIAFGEQKHSVDEQIISEVIDIAQLAPMVARLNDGLLTIVGEHGARLSGGQKQRIAIARALYLNPDVLIFDEATSALDNETEAKLIEELFRRRSSQTIIMITHRLSLTKKCDRVFEMQNGQLSEKLSWPK